MKRFADRYFTKTRTHEPFDPKPPALSADRRSGDARPAASTAGFDFERGAGGRSRGSESNREDETAAGGHWARAAVIRGGSAGAECWFDYSYTTLHLTICLRVLGTQFGHVQFPRLTNQGKIDPDSPPLSVISSYTPECSMHGLR